MPETESVREFNKAGAFSPEERLAHLEATVKKMRVDQKAAMIEINEILALMRGTQTAFGIARRYGKPVALFVSGILVSRGIISAETGKSFFAIFGF